MYSVGWNCFSIPKLHKTSKFVVNYYIQLFIIFRRHQQDGNTEEMKNMNINDDV